VFTVFSFEPSVGVSCMLCTLKKPTYLPPQASVNKQWSENS